jgi:uncharacterized lipoprotein YmbA
MIRFRFSAAAAALLLSGCASGPTQYLTLVPPAGKTPGGSGDAAGVPVVSVVIPSQVDQPELVVRRSDGSMALLESERWIAPLSDEIRTALSLSLARQWESVPSTPSPQDSKSSTRVAVDIQRFDSVPGQYALIDAVWTLTTGGSAAQTVSCRSSIRVPVAEGYTALARGHQAAVEELASQIARQAAKLRSADMTCNAP